MGDWYLRRYEPSDWPKLKTFTCYTPGQKWTKVPQKLIRDTPGLLGAPDEDIRILLACQVTFDWRQLRPKETGVILGAAVYAIEGDQFVSHTRGAPVRHLEGKPQSLRDWSRPGASRSRSDRTV